MLNKQLLDPESIVVVGGSNNTHKPGGNLVKNIIEGGYHGSLFVVNPNEDEVQGLKCYRDINLIPDADLAFLAIPAKSCKGVVDILLNQKSTRAFVIISAGFSEEGGHGGDLEKNIAEQISKSNGCLIGPNCIGIINEKYQGIFTSPVPRLNNQGCDFISASGATAMFIIESAMQKGLTFSSVYTVGNSAQVGFEDIIEYMDNAFNPAESSKTKLLYIEHIKNPDKLLKHARSLISKGCRIAAIKSGGSEAGSRAALSHTGALAGSDLAVDALFRKAGIVRCFGREELTTVASVFMHPEIKGKNIAIVTHAGGPAVMLTDSLSNGGLNIPKIDSAIGDELLSKLNEGASVSNPIDLLATGTKEQLGIVLDYCDKKFKEIDAIMVIFGSTGLQPVFDAYEVLHQKMNTCSKPIFPILPSISSARNEVDLFLSKGHINFPDEVLLGKAVSKIFSTPRPADVNMDVDKADINTIKSIIDQAQTGFVAPGIISEMLQAANIPKVKEGMARNKRQLLALSKEIGFPLVMKVVGPLHKSDINGVVLNINTEKHLVAEFRRLMKIQETHAVLLQPMISGIELFIGAKYEPSYGHVILCGLGGIFVEVLQDVSSGLAPLTINETYSMIRSLKSYRIIQGARGQEGINEEKFAQIIVNLSVFLRYATEIKELDLNPLIGSGDEIFVVDARIRIDKSQAIL